MKQHANLQATTLRPSAATRAVHARAGSIPETVIESAPSSPSQTAHPGYTPATYVPLTDDSQHQRSISITITPPGMNARHPIGLYTSAPDTQVPAGNAEPTDGALTPITMSPAPSENGIQPIHEDPATDTNGSIITVEASSESPKNLHFISNGRLRLLRFQKHTTPKMERRNPDSIEGSRVLTCESVQGRVPFKIGTKTFDKCPSQESGFSKHFQRYDSEADD